MNFLFIGMGFLFLGIGVIGVIVPLLPTTPFLLLASICFAKGSKRFHDYFKSTQIYKNNLEAFEQNRSMTMKTKICILLPVSIMLLIAFFMMHNLYGRITILAVVLFKYYYFIFKIKTLKVDNKNESPNM